MHSNSTAMAEFVMAECADDDDPEWKSFCKELATLLQIPYYATQDEPWFDVIYACYLAGDEACEVWRDIRDEVRGV